MVSTKVGFFFSDDACGRQVRPPRGLKKLQRPGQAHQKVRKREGAGPLEGRGLGGGGCGAALEADLGGKALIGGGGIVSPGPTSWSRELKHAPPAMAISHLPSIPDQEPPQCPDDITKEKRTPALEPESCEAS